MGKEAFLLELQESLDGWGDLVFHFTRNSYKMAAGDDWLASLVLDQPALVVLKEKILAPGVLQGGTRYIKGGHRCVRFTETKMGDLPRLFAIIEKHFKGRYLPYGVAVTKQWLFDQGGRPVIYQPADDFEHLPEVLQHRHVSFTPPGTDFTWEREWRIKADSLKLDPEQTLVIVRTEKEASEIRAIGAGDGETGAGAISTWEVRSLEGLS